VTRALAVVLGGLWLLAAAAPPPALPLPPPAPLPLPPPLPTDPPTDLAAPIPNDDVRAPGTAAENPSTDWALRVYRMQDLGTGGGYVPGSAYQSPEQRKPMQTPGFIVMVPLQ
jgi:hypothetical protein